MGANSTDDGGVHTASDPARRRPGLLDTGISLLVVSNLAVAQPVLDLLGRHAEFFVAHRAGTWELVTLALALTLAAPLVLAGIVVGVRRLRAGAGYAAHWALFALFASVLALQLLTRLSVFDDHAWLAITAALACGTLAATAYTRTPALQSVVRYGVVLPVVVAGLFLVVSPAAALVGSDGAQERAYAVGSPAPVVMIVFDEFPAASLLDAGGRIDREAYPNFARLAERSSWYRDATTVHEHTTQAVPAILTGRYPDPDALPIVAHHPDNLFTLLGEDYAFRVLEPLTDLCPDHLCDSATEEPRLGANLRAMTEDIRIVWLHMVLPRVLRQRLPPIDSAWTGFGLDGEAPEGVPDGEAPEAVPDPEPSPSAGATGEESFDLRGRIDDLRSVGEDELFTAFVDSLDPQRQPTLYFLHILLPHSPWRFLPSGQSYSPSPTLGRDDEPPYSRWGADRHLVELSYGRHLLQVGYTDRMLGEVLDRLDEEGIYDEALVVVTADHGISFGTERYLRHPVEGTLAEIAAVPLFVKAPGQREGRTIDDPVQLVDVLPTITDLLEVRDAPTLDGRSLAGTPRPTTDRRLLRSGKESLEFGALLGDIVEVAGRKVDLFGPGVPDLAAATGHGDLVGRRTTDLPVEDPQPAWGVFIGDRERYDDVRLDEPLPALVRGRLHGPASIEEGTVVAVAVGGEIAGVAALTDSDGTAGSFYVLLPPEALVEGPNVLETFAIEPGTDVLLRVEQRG